ncbi:MAG: VTT domain-containing protein [Clostridia bacterium]|nr:VTT domain-containing protein [Clostridia bacterium]
MKKKLKIDAVTFWGIVFIAVAMVLFVAVGFFKLPHIQEWYEQYEHIIVRFQERIINIDNKLWIVLIVMLLYLFKAFIPFPVYPASFLLIIISIVFDFYVSVIINIVGFIILFCAKYFWGKKFGCGVAGKLLSKYHKIWNIIEHEGNGNPWLLTVFRAIPAFPINSVSCLYGSMDFSFWKYILLSVTGYMPKLISYTIIGRNVFNPLSSAFILPIALLLLFSGLSMVGVNTLVDAINKKINSKKIS